MKQVRASLLFALMVTCLGAVRGYAEEQNDARDLGAYHIRVEYYAPRDDSGLLKYYENLKQRHVLERLGQFLTPVEWPQQPNPHTLRLIAKGCGGQATIFYNPDEYSISVCYEAIQNLQKALQQLNERYPQTTQYDGHYRVGWLVGNLLHEASRAVFDMLRVPIFGSQDDAADQTTALIALQFGPEVAQTLIVGYGLAIPLERQHNISCIAYGGQQATFQFLVDQGMLPKSRAEHCADEYQEAAYGFEKLVQPSIAKPLMKKVLATPWITPEDFQ
jgi:Putative metallopeptidase